MPSIVKFRQKVEWRWSGAWGKDDGAFLFNGSGVLVLQDENVLEMDGSNGCATM